MSASPAVPFAIACVHFDHPTGQAILLRDHADDSRLGASPEWDDGGRDVPVAFVGGETPTLLATFRGQPSAGGQYGVGAAGLHASVAEQLVTLTFDPSTGLSTPVALRLERPLPAGPGRHQLAFDWYASQHGKRSPVGISVHRVLTTWRRMRPVPDQGLESWAYARLVEWACEWAAGQDDEKAVCDALISNLPRSGLRYGVRATDARDLLVRNGGMCGQWYQLFQLLAHTQGVFLHRRCFLVDWQTLADGEEAWCAMVIRAPGLNQPEPPPAASEFHDHDGSFAGTADCLISRVERRYRFWGMPGWFYDGHCVNFLTHAGRVYLYDPCFAGGPHEIDGPLPPDDMTVWGGPTLSSFKSRYLDGAVDYMLGSLYNGGRLVRSVFSPDPRLSVNGVTVKTAAIPATLDGRDGLTFAWVG